METLSANDCRPGKNAPSTQIQMPCLLTKSQMGAEGCAIGLDIGGTKAAGGLLLFPQGEVLMRRSILTRPNRQGREVLQDILELTSSLVQEATAMDREVESIGAGVAELVDGDGEITSAQTIPWRGLPLRQKLSQLAPAVVESDVRAAALGEAFYGAGLGYDCFVYLTIGTGISYSLVQGGKPYAGAHGNALVLASSPMSYTCPHCKRQSSMVLEDYASGPAIARRYSLRIGRDDVTGEDVIRAADRGETDAVEVATSAGEALGATVGFLVNLLDPRAIVVGGGLGLCEGCYWQSFVESTRQHIWAEASRGVPIVKAVLGRDAGIVGAAAVAWQRRRIGDNHFDAVENASSRARRWRISD